MKKFFTLAMLAYTSFGVSAAAPEVVVYDFNNTPDFFPVLQAPVSEGGMGQTGNFEFVKNTGAVGVPYGVGAGSDELLVEKYTDVNGDAKWRARQDFRVRFSLADGVSCGLGADGKYTYEGFELDKNYPFIGYGDKGPTRILWMPGWGSEDEWNDANYNAIDAENWVATKHAIQFSRNGNSASRTDTWIQFPKYQGPFTCTYYIASLSDSSRNKEQPLRCRVVPVTDDETELDDLAQITNRPYAEIKDKRYYKMTYSYSGNDAIALRIGADGAQLALFHVVFSPGASESGIEDIIINPVADENAPIYNVLGVQVDENYKGIVIKNGKKYIQK